MKVRGSKVVEGSVVVVNGRRIVVTAVRRAIHRPDVARVVTGSDGHEVVIDARSKYDVLVSEK